MPGDDPIPDHPWVAVIHDSDERLWRRVSLHLRRNGRNYHIGLRMPPDMDRVLQQRANIIAETLNRAGVIGGQEFQGRDLLTFPEVVA